MTNLESLVEDFHHEYKSYYPGGGAFIDVPIESGASLALYSEFSSSINAVANSKPGFYEFPSIPILLVIPDGTCRKPYFTVNLMTVYRDRPELFS